MDVMDIWDPLSDPADELPLVIANHPRDVARTAEAQGEHEQKKKGGKNEQNGTHCGDFVLWFLDINSPEN